MREVIVGFEKKVPVPWRRQCAGGHRRRDEKKAEHKTGGERGLLLLKAVRGRRDLVDVAPTPMAEARFSSEQLKLVARVGSF